MAEASIPGERNQDQFAHHLTATEAGEIAQRAGAEALILTHLRPSLDRGLAAAAAGEVFAGKVSVAAPGDIYEI
jgi:ribonuclease BN (tRNA processing enzyme)